MVMILKTIPTLSEAAHVKQLSQPATEVTVQAGAYSQDVRDQVARLVLERLSADGCRPSYMTCGCSECMAEWALGDDFDWSTGGTKLHKRLRSKINRRHSISLPEDFLRTIAELAAGERNTISRKVDATTEFTWKPGEYGDNRSCFYSTYRHARLNHLPRVGASAIRSHLDNGDGRYWMFPLPIFAQDYRDQPIYVAFNGYGVLKDNKELYYATMLAVAEAKWARSFATTTIILNMENVYVNRDERCTLVHPAGLDIADFAQTLARAGERSEPLRHTPYGSFPFTVTMNERTYEQVNLPLPAWTQWADGHYCYGCNNFHFDRDLRTRHGDKYCQSCFTNRGWRWPTT